jgi:regulator of sigma E protease
MDLLIFIGALAGFILLHEIGHFLAARLLKVEVEEFGFGIPPRMLKLFTWRGTDFTLNWIPLGGFVRPRGENDPAVPGGLAAASPWVRFGVLIAGPLMNILTAILLYAIAFSRVGVPDTTKVLVMEIAPGSPAEQAGLLPGDLLLEVNGKPVPGQSAVHDAIQASLGMETAIVYERAGQRGTVTLVPRSNPPEGQGAIGITMVNPSRPVSVLQVLPYGALAVTDLGYNLLTLPVQLARGAVAPEEARLVGFKGMYDLYQEVREVEASPVVPREFNTLAFFAMISTSLGVLNLLPIPALDGGRILFLLPEMLFRRRVPHRLETAIHTVSFMLLLFLLVYINLQDFINPVNFQINP